MYNSNNNNTISLGEGLHVVSWTLVICLPYLLCPRVKHTIHIIIKTFITIIIILVILSMVSTCSRPPVVVNSEGPTYEHGLNSARLLLVS